MPKADFTHNTIKLQFNSIIKAAVLIRQCRLWGGAGRGTLNTPIRHKLHSINPTANITRASEAHRLKEPSDHNLPKHRSRGCFEAIHVYW